MLFIGKMLLQEFCRKNVAQCYLDTDTGHCEAIRYLTVWDIASLVSETKLSHLDGHIDRGRN